MRAGGRAVAVVALAVSGDEGIDADRAVDRHLDAAVHFQRAERAGRHALLVAVGRRGGVDGRRSAVGQHEGDAARQDILHAAARDGLDVGAARSGKQVVQHVGREGDVFQVDKELAVAADGRSHRVLPEGIGRAADLEVGGSQIKTFGDDDREHRIGGVRREAVGGRHRAADAPALELVAGRGSDGGQGVGRACVRVKGHFAAVLRDRVAADGIADVGGGRERDGDARLRLRRDCDFSSYLRRTRFCGCGDGDLEIRTGGDGVALRSAGDR